MDAAADYSAVRRALANADLPAYVSYTVRSHAGVDALRGEETASLTVRTSDGTIVSGKAPKLHVDADRSFEADVVRHGPFRPECYAPQAAAMTTFERRPAEAIALRSVCHAIDRGPSTAAFTTLYLDPRTRVPLAVVGDSAEHGVSAHVDERFARVDRYVLPTALHVKVSGSGPLFWLNVDAGQTYADYRFSDRAP